jgi:protein-tyrosine phosphatase
MILAAACVAAQSAPVWAGARGIPFEAAEVSSPDGHEFTVTWRAPGVRHVSVFAGTDPDHVRRHRPVAQGTGVGEATVSNLPPAPRWYFLLVPDRGDSLLVADRSLHLSTAANFRDAGGYRTADGKWVRMGLAYRSNGIEHLTDEELAVVGRLGIKLVCDLRTAEEIHRGPDRVPGAARDISADVLADDAELIHSLMAGGGGPSREGLEERIYRDFVRLPSAQTAYRSLFERLADPAELPTVFHCTAGKDRTGWGQAVFLTLLGVSRATVMQDYELTNQYLQGRAADSVRQSAGQVAPSALTANPAALDDAFDQVTQDYGSFDRYVSQGLHLSDATVAAIRKNFLAE